MTRKDYVLIASAVRKANETLCLQAGDSLCVAQILADALAQGNALFNYNRFVDACCPPSPDSLGHAPAKPRPSAGTS